MKALLVVLLLAGTAHADRQKILVLPLPAGSVAADAARAFDARLLVSLEDTGRVTTVTATEEPECVTPACLAQLAIQNGADAALSISAVRERGRIRLFAALIDKAGTTARRTELAALDAVAVARDIAGTPPGPPLLGVVLPANGLARDAGDAVAGQLARFGTFRVVALDADSAALTHRADFTITRISLDERVHHVHHYIDGALTATLSITDLATGQVVFAKTVTVTASRRARKSTRTEVAGQLVDGAVSQWLTAFRGADVETQLKGPTR